MNYLVVDDEPAICDGTLRRLRKIIRPGDRIWAAYSGEEALEILAAESIAVLITDIQMDALSGLGLIERAEKLQPIPMACIVITAHEIFEYARRAMELGVRDYLLKPYSESELTAAVSKAVATLENQWLLGRMKLEKALRDFGVKPEGYVCSDSGASTGGFTDCMLQNGAVKVYAVDVGYGQLAWSLRTDERVVNMERTNIRNVKPEDLSEPVAFFSVDVSFISLKHIFPVADTICTPEAVGVCLVKPQFEAGREKVGKKGVVRDPATHREVLKMAEGYAMANHFTPAGLDFSPIKGPEGNIEYLLYVQHCETPQPLPDGLIEKVVAASHETLDKTPNHH